MPKIGTPKVLIVSYSKKSTSARVLQKKFIKPINLQDADLIVNWGIPGRDYPEYKYLVLNKKSAVLNAVNKLKAFRAFRVNNIIHPTWTTNREEAMSWCTPSSDETKGSVVGFARTKLTAHSGRGIIPFFDGPNYRTTDHILFPNAQLYVKYIPSVQEFRVHVFQGEIMLVQEKRKSKRNWDDATSSRIIRNHRNGWVFCRKNVKEPKTLREQCVAAVAALQLDFGAVDVIYNKDSNTCYILEVNCAPGLEGSTIDNYVNSISGAARER